jgi:hypothetical protein
MANDPSKAAFWKEFICARSEFPFPEILRAQFSQAVVTEYCDCGCNAFALAVMARDGVPPLHKCGTEGAVFELHFWLADPIPDGPQRGTLEVVVMTDAAGYVSFVDVGCCANTYPVPDQVRVDEPPCYINVAEACLPQA